MPCKLLQSPWALGALPRKEIYGLKLATEVSRKCSHHLQAYLRATLGPMYAIAQLHARDTLMHLYTLSLSLSETVGVLWCVSQCYCTLEKVSCPFLLPHRVHPTTDVGFVQVNLCDPVGVMKSPRSPL